LPNRRYSIFNEGESKEGKKKGAPTSSIFTNEKEDSHSKGKSRKKGGFNPPIILKFTNPVLAD